MVNLSIFLAKIVEVVTIGQGGNTQKDFASAQMPAKSAQTALPWAVWRPLRPQKVSQFNCPLTHPDTACRFAGVRCRRVSELVAAGKFQLTDLSPGNTGSRGDAGAERTLSNSTTANWLAPVSLAVVSVRTDLAARTVNCDFRRSAPVDDFQPNGSGIVLGSDVRQIASCCGCRGGISPAAACRQCLAAA